MPQPFCRAPREALYFDPAGQVWACCSGQLLLGTIGVDPLVGIWDGARRQRLVQAIDTGDLSLGCSACAPPLERTDTLAPQFDALPDPEAREYPRYLDFALDNTCNLQCVMCSGELSSAIRAQREHRPPLVNPYGDAFFDELAPLLPHVVEVSFKGGEPFLSRTTRRVWDLLARLDRQPGVTVTTNGTIWNDTVERYVRDLRMSVCLSIDGITAETVEAIRVGVDLPQLLEHIDRFKAATSAVGRPLRLTYCLQQGNWHELGRFLAFCEAKELSANVIHLTYPERFDLARSSRARLVEVVEELERDPSGARLTTLRPVWEQALARLREAASSPSELSAVALGYPRSGPTASELETELLAWADQEVVHLDLLDQVVVGVTSLRGGAGPPRDWHRFVGAAVDELEARATALLGPLEVVSVGDERHGGFDIVQTFCERGVTLRIRAVNLAPFPTSAGLRQDLYLAVASGPIRSS